MIVKLKRKIGVVGVFLLISSACFFVYFKPNLEINSNLYGNRSFEILVHRNKTMSKRSENKTEVPLKKKEKVFFLQMQGSGSSAIFQALIFWGIRLKKRFTLPRDVSVDEFWPNTLNVKRTARNAYQGQMLINAVRYSNTIEKVMPPSETFYITIMREPVEMLKSIYYSYKLDTCLMYSFNEFFEERRYIDSSLDSCYITTLHDLIIFNLGLSPTDDQKKVEQLIQHMDSKFDLVLIYERLEECLILLRDLIGMTTEEVAPLKSLYELKRTSEKVSNETLKSIAQWNWADNLVYQHFKSKTYKILEEKQEYIRQEVKKLQEAQKRLENYCSHQNNPDEAIDETSTYSLPTDLHLAAIDFCQMKSSQDGLLTQAVLRHAG